MNDPRQPAQPLNPAHPAPQHPAQPLHPAQPRPVVAAPRPAIVPRPVQTMPTPAQPPKKDDAPISLDDEIDATAAAPNRKIVFGPEIGHKKHDWQRQTKVSGTGAVRMRSFHGKLSEQGLEYIDDAINTWLDANPDVEVKFVTSTVGMFEGKMKDLALILNVWY